MAAEGREALDAPLLPANLHMMLAADERETLAHLKQEVPDPYQQRAFQIPLPGIRRDRQTIELVRVLDDLLRQSDSAGGKMRAKFVTAWPCRSLSRVSI
jgi:hypothetical protein